MPPALSFGDEYKRLPLAAALRIYRGWTETDVAVRLSDADQLDRVELAMAIEEEFGVVVDVGSELKQDADDEKQ